MTTAGTPGRRGLQALRTGLLLAVVAVVLTIGRLELSPQAPPPPAPPMH